MAKKISKDAALIIHQFMIDDMGLSGAHLLVYALIYAFTNQSKGFFGTKEYISQRTGCSQSSVKRILHILREKKFIKRTYDDERGNYIYTALSPPDEEDKNDTDGRDVAVQFERSEGSFCTPEGFILDPQEKEKKKNITTTSKATDTGGGNSSSSSLFRFFGAEGLVMLTEGQYSRLCSLLGNKTAEAYICRVEAFLLSNPSAYLKNHYKTILDWAREDAEL